MMLDADIDRLPPRLGWHRVLSFARPARIMEQKAQQEGTGRAAAASPSTGVSVSCYLNLGGTFYYRARFSGRPGALIVHFGSASG